MDPVQAAARRTLAEGSARIRTLFDSSFDPAEIAFGSEGIADLTRRLTVREERSAKLDEFADKIAGRFPWLEDENGERNGPGEDEPYVTYEQGRTVIHGARGHWVRHDLEHRSWRDPTFVLDLLAENPLDGLRLEGEEPVRGAACKRYGGRLDSKRFEAARGAEPGGEPDRTLHVKAWVDRDGRLVRGSWVHAQAGRPRSPFRPKHEPAWRTVEFWDFGLDADIRMPSVEPRSPEAGENAPSTIAMAAEVAGLLWRQRRDWKRRQR